MRPYMLRKPDGINIDVGFIDEVRRISQRRRGLIEDEDDL
jgi:hypothetical protein